MPCRCAGRSPAGIGLKRMRCLEKVCAWWPHTDKRQVRDMLLRQIAFFNTVVAVVADKEMDDATFGGIMFLAGKPGGLIFLPPAISSL